MSEIIVGIDSTGKLSTILANKANRHGLIAGATGTGKTVTLQVLAEQFSRMGVPVFTSDVKGDLSGLGVAGSEHPKITERLEKIGLEDFDFAGAPVTFWDLYGKKGHSVRTTVSEMGPVLLARLLDVNEIQTDVLTLAFKFADDEGLLLLDLKDLKSILAEMAERASELQTEYGNISKSSVGAIVRRLVTLEDAGGDFFFGEPALQLKHMMRVDASGRGVINILDATKLIQDTRLYGTFLLWLLSELFEELPEVGNPDKPKLVFFFDEAHLLFKDASKALLEKIEMVVRLIRSKGVGIYFVTQSPTDVPEEILGQLGNRIQHALRAFTEKDQKDVRIAAKTFRINPDIDAEKVITELGTGESLVSTLDEKGSPLPVVKVLNSPPRSQMKPMDEQQRTNIISSSLLGEVYDTAVDRESAFELLQKRNEERDAEAAKLDEEEEKEKPKKKGSNRQGMFESFFKSVLRSIGSKLGREIIRGVLGSIKR